VGVAGTRRGAGDRAGGARCRDTDRNRFGSQDSARGLDNQGAAFWNSGAGGSRFPVPPIAIEPSADQMSLF
jgi:hypothetical protein